MLMLLNLGRPSFGRLLLTGGKARAPGKYKECSSKRGGIGMSKLKARIDKVDSGFGVSSEGEFNRVGEGVLKLIDWLAPISELSC